MGSSADSKPLAAPNGAHPFIVLVAGEASGDQLGGALITALRELYPEARFAGVGGPLMAAAGMETWVPSDELAVMGLFEVLGHLPRLLTLRKRLARKIIEARPDLLIGIDSPDFNLGLERRVRAAGIRSIHYVSPTVWAWRQGRVRKIARSTDMVMCLFPFEPAFYKDHGVPAHYTGHPMADAIPLEFDRAESRRKLGLPADGTCVALLPGSRLGEVGRLAAPLLGAAEILVRARPGIHFVIPAAGAAARSVIERELQRHPELEATVVDRQGVTAMAAADVVACASGTAALEAMLVHRPMVAVYRLSGATYWLARGLRLFKSRFFSLPNILADKALVPELLQDQVTPSRVSKELSRWLDQPDHAREIGEVFAGMHSRLRQDAARKAAGCVHTLLEQGLQ